MGLYDKPYGKRKDIYDGHFYMKAVRPLAIIRHLKTEWYVFVLKEKFKKNQQIVPRVLMIETQVGFVTHGQWLS